MKLPVKWMALEGLNNGIFSEKSDVVGPPFNSSPSLCDKCCYFIVQWSFGVTCWEMFSLGKNPYPGVDPFSLIRYLERGERLDKPVLAACSQEMYGDMLSVMLLSSLYTIRYDMMSECWEVELWKRPHFSQLVTVISTSLEGMAVYLDLNYHIFTAPLN